MSESLPEWLQPVSQRLREWQAQRGLPHALLFSGPDGIGKQLLVEQLAAGLLCRVSDGLNACGECRDCRPPLREHPDCHWLEREQRADKKGLKRQLTVDVIRDAVQEINKTSHGGGVKLFILPEADKLNLNAANALLKTLEEPPKDSYLILSSEAPGRLLPTVRSRCQELTCAPPSPPQVETWLAVQSDGETLRKHLLEFPEQPFALRDFVDKGIAAQWQANDGLMQAVVAGRQLPLALTDDLLKQEDFAVLDWLASRSGHWCHFCAGRSDVPDWIRTVPRQPLKRAVALWRFVLMLREEYRSGATPSLRYALDKLFLEWLREG